MKKFKLLAIFLGLLQNFAHAQTSSQYVSPYGSIINIRAYVNGIVYIDHSVGVCAFKTFTVDTATPGGKAMYAAAMAGFVAQKPVALEIPNNITCVWGMPLQSIFVNP
ncbi:MULTISPECIES: hypothetical protein [unclassified Janthinobacterium]|uniref:hypothetical protein n=1 Tax=unclassified Janthinobacterium TaxID=2610881 RepID=UPI0012F8B1D7|nr:MULTISPECIES: hypothetical protein [unclassified Janthinobacterium]MEC5161534.1 hypothetical protein [Janthinobacterium sp. CG_S6]